MVFCAAYAPRTSQTHFLPWPQLSSPSPSPHRPPLEPTLVWAGWLFFHFPFPAHMHFFEKYAHVRLLLFFLSNTHQLLETIIYIHSLTALSFKGHAQSFLFGPQGNTAQAGGFDQKSKWLRLRRGGAGMRGDTAVVIVAKREGEGAG